MGIGTQRCEDSADVSTLKRIGNLNAKEAEAQIPHLPK
jgi:hypothetical protein